MRHVISALVMNEPGVLAHVAGMFSARGFNIDSLVVGRTEDPALSRMTIVVNADDRILEQVRKQLAKIVTVVRVRDYKDLPFVERDLALIKISTPPGKRSEVHRTGQPFPRPCRGCRRQHRDGPDRRRRRKDRRVCRTRPRPTASRNSPAPA